jgi:hypothetical protein
MLLGEMRWCEPVAPMVEAVPYSGQKCVKERDMLGDVALMGEYRMFQKELYNFKSLCKCIRRICTVF